MIKLKKSFMVGFLGLCFAAPSISMAQSPSYSLDSKIDALEKIKEQAKAKMSEEEKSVYNKVSDKFPNAVILGDVEKVSDNLYQIWFSGQVSYTDSNVNYMLTGGSLIDAKAMRNITDDFYKEKSDGIFKALPLETALKKVYGNGEHKIAVFLDPECPYCQDFASTLNDNKENLNLTVYEFLLPLETLHPGTYDKTVKIACSDDATETLKNIYINGQEEVQANKCKKGEKLVNYHMAVAEGYGIRATPTIIFENDEVYPGSISYASLNKILRYVDQENKNKEKEKNSQEQSASQ